MFVAVILSENKSLLTIPIKWIKNHESLLVRYFNSAVKRWRREIIFLSKSFEVEPEFQLEIKSSLDLTTNACYYANLLRAFGTEMEAEIYADMRRPVLPVNYTERIRRNSLLKEKANSQTSLDDEDERFLSDVIPVPIRVKIEDALSGKLYFVLQVRLCCVLFFLNLLRCKPRFYSFQNNMDRFYENFGVLLRESTVETLLLWNTDDEYKGENYDFFFVQFLIMGCIEHGASSKATFLDEIFKHRANDNQARCIKLKQHIQNATVQIISTGTTDVDSDIECSSADDPMPRPMAFINLKTEDVFSGTIPFTMIVSAKGIFFLHTCVPVLPINQYFFQNSDRYYGSYDLTLRDSVITTLLLWNSDEEYRSQTHDYVFVQFLCTAMLSKVNDEAEKIDLNWNDRIDFLNKVFRHRIGENTHRYDMIGQYISMVQNNFQGNRKNNVRGKGNNLSGQQNNECQNEGPTTEYENPHNLSGKQNTENECGSAELEVLGNLSAEQNTGNENESDIAPLCPLHTAPEVEHENNDIEPVSIEPDCDCEKDEIASMNVDSVNIFELSSISLKLQKTDYFVFMFSQKMTIVLTENLKVSIVEILYNQSITNMKTRFRRKCHSI